MAMPARSPDPDRRRRPSRGLAGVALAGLLLVLGGVLFPVQRRVGELRDQLYEVADPTADMIGEVQYLLARQTSALRGYLITGDSSYLVQYDSLRLREESLYPELEALAESLSPRIAADVAELVTLSEQWHGRLQLGQLAGAAPGPDAPVILLEQTIYRRALESASQAMLTTRDIMRERETEIESVERDARLILSSLVLLSVLVGLFIAALNSRIRSLAAEAESRRREAEAAVAETERAVAERAYLLRGFTHDVKNPLNVADGYADLLELGYRGALPAEQLQMVGRIRASIRSAVRIIEELLEISRLESGGVRLERRPVDVATLVSEAVQQHALSASRAGLRIHDRARSTAPLVVVTDPERLHQIVKNLLSNAVKYTPTPGEVTVEVARAPEDLGPGPGPWARIVVRDTGPGIPPEEQEAIFQEFHRIPGTSAEGHGLGLAISRRLARMLGGDLTVESGEGPGSSFAVWLPIASEDATSPRPHQGLRGIEDRPAREQGGGPGSVRPGPEHREMGKRAPRRRPRLSESDRTPDS